MCGRLVELLLHEAPKMRGLALRIVVYIVGGNDKQTRVRGAYV